MKAVAIDIGGTFTDLAALDVETGELRFAKSLTTPPEFEGGAMDCLAQAEIRRAQSRSSGTARPWSSTRCSNAGAPAPRW